MADTLGDQQLFDSIKNHLQHFVALNEERREVVLEAANLLSSLKKRSTLSQIRIIHVNSELNNLIILEVNEDSEESLRKLVDCYAKIAKSATDEFS